MKIRVIAFPNTVEGEKQASYSSVQGHSFEKIDKPGEMAAIGWIRVLKDGKPVAEIKESVCDIYYVYG